MRPNKDGRPGGEALNGQQGRKRRRSRHSRFKTPPQRLRRLAKAVLVDLALSGHLPEPAADWLLYAGGLCHE